MLVRALAMGHGNGPGVVDKIESYEALSGQVTLRGQLK